MSGEGLFFYEEAPNYTTLWDSLTDLGVLSDRNERHGSSYAGDSSSKKGIDLILAERLNFREKPTL
jgi:hypothetical protein